MGSIFTLIFLYFLFSFIKGIVKGFCLLMRNLDYKSQGSSSFLQKFLIDIRKAILSSSSYDYTKNSQDTSQYRNNSKQSNQNRYQYSSFDWQQFSDTNQKNNSKSDVNNSNKTMSLQEAKDILGIGENTSHDEIMKAFKRLMLINHPDKGGSQYLASKIIEAKNRLLKQ